ncbi:MAG: S41 family peptidase [Clostridia bacterium]|nr:S41 family peptidase [Clostridia bacterium]
MKNKFRRSFIAVFIIICILLSQSVFAESDSSSATDRDVEYLKSIMDMIKEKYRGEITDDQLIEGALKGMFGTMDQYTQYMTNDEAESFYTGLEGSFFGLGIVMKVSGKYIMVEKVFPGSPAEKAGIFPGDRIVSVNGKSIIGATTKETAELIKGPAGKKVILQVQRGLKNKAVKIQATVGQVNISPVEYEIRNGIAYIQLSSFGINADNAMTEVLDKIDKAKVTKVVLDLRNNPGGYVDVAVAIARKFVPKGLITKLDYKSEGYSDIEYNSYLEKTKYKLAVLVNGGSASASEIFAGAVQDTKAGTLIGTKTFGKAKVQNLIPILTPEAFEKYEAELGVKLVDVYQLVNEYGITPLEDEIIGYSKITTGVYTTPKGRMIDLKGLTPDITVPDPAPSKGIYIGSVQKLKMAKTPGLNESSVDVFYAETILNLLGYNVDEADSILDKKTCEAIRKFQKSKGGKPSDRLDTATQKWLNAELDKLRSSLDKQYGKAVEVLNK